jgi:hypothetical protein
MGFALVTGTVFFYGVSTNRPIWGKTWFWGALVAFGGVHLVVGITLVSYSNAVPLILFPPVALLEFTALALLLGYCESRFDKK